MSKTKEIRVYQVILATLLIIGGIFCVLFGLFSQKTKTVTFPTVQLDQETSVQLRHMELEYDFFAVKLVEVPIILVDSQTDLTDGILTVMIETTNETPIKIYEKMLRLPIDYNYYLNGLDEGRNFRLVGKISQYQKLKLTVKLQKANGQILEKKKVVSLE